MPAYSPAEIHSLFRNAFNAGDVRSLIALYEPNAVLIAGGTRVIGREDIGEAFQGLLTQRGEMTLETGLVVESPEGLAVLHGSWRVEPPANSGAAATQGVSTEVVRKQADGDRKSTRLNSSHVVTSRMPSSA